MDREMAFMDESTALKRLVVLKTGACLVMSLWVNLAIAFLCPPLLIATALTLNGMVAKSINC